MAEVIFEAIRIIVWGAAAVFFLYIAVRVVGIAWFRSKLEYFRNLRKGSES